jgi:hypothetical protein
MQRRVWKRRLTSSLALVLIEVLWPDDLDGSIIETDPSYYGWRISDSVVCSDPHPHTIEEVSMAKRITFNDLPSFRAQQ